MVFSRLSMKKKFLVIPMIWLLILACQVIPTPPPVTPAPEKKHTQNPPGFSETQDVSGKVTAVPGILAPPTFELAPIDNLSKRFFETTNLVEWTLADGYQDWFDLPVDLRMLDNPVVLAGLTNAQRNQLAEKGFLVLENREKSFATLRHKVSEQYGQPYFLSLDAARFGLKSNIDALLLALEREVLLPKMTDVVRSTMDEVQRLYPGLQSAGLEQDAGLSLVYLAVGLRLLDPSSDLSLAPDLEALCLAQLEQILHPASSRELLLLPGTSFDFEIFDVPDYYLGDQDLEAFYRGKNWFEEVGFTIDDRPGLLARRVPLIITMALRRTGSDGQLPAQAWIELDDWMSFFYGRSQDDDPRRYAQLMDRVYGNKISVLTLADEDLWRTFRVLVQTLPSPKVYSALSRIPVDLSGVHDWRFLGRRQLPDTMALSALPIARDLVTDLPHYSASGLDWMAMTGWQPAEEILKSYLIAQSEDYSTVFKNLQTDIQSQDEQEWVNTLWGGWNYAGLPPKEFSQDVFPSFMQQETWKNKELASALGGWVLSNHRFGNFPMINSEHEVLDLPIFNPAPAFVQPSPEAFYRMSYLANGIVDGLALSGISSSLNTENSSQGLALRVQELRDLGDRLARFGDIAVKELKGLPLDKSDFAVIQAPLGPVDVFNQDNIALSSEKILPVFAIATPEQRRDQVLQVGIGLLDWLYVIVPWNDGLTVAQGGVFSYYEFNQPADSRLFDNDWLWIVNNAQPVRPAWSQVENSQEGVPYFVLAFRIGDSYRVTPSGEDLSVRTLPTRTADANYHLRSGEYIRILDGPVNAEGSTWWMVEILDSNGMMVGEGWVRESQEWFERLWHK